MRSIVYMAAALMLAAPAAPLAETEPTPLFNASQMIGAALVDTEETALGRIEDVTLAPEGIVVGVIVSLDGVEPPRRIGVPFEALTPTEAGFSAPTTAEELAARPEVDPVAPEQAAFAPLTAPQPAPAERPDWRERWSAKVSDWTTRLGEGASDLGDAARERASTGWDAVKSGWSNLKDRAGEAIDSLQNGSDGEQAQ